MVNKKISKWSFVCLAAFGLVWGVKELYFFITDGFSIANVTSDHIDGPEWETYALSESERAEVEVALTQEYTYLAKGIQAYAFESQDKKYVIKLLKFQAYRSNRYLPWIGNWGEARKKRLQYKINKRDALFRSWKFAFEDLKDETGVMYIHINRTKDFQKTITVRNKSGIPYTLELDNYVFMVQRRAELLSDFIKDSAASGNLVKAKEIVDRLIDLYVSEYNRGLAEKDVMILRNTGVYGDRPIHIDTGRLCREEELKDSKKHHQELVWKTGVILKWFDEFYPDLATHLRGRLSSLKS